MGVVIAHVTLHVGLGTFRPVKEDNILQHHMHSEEYEILPDAADTINRVKKAGGRIICVGTTSCRTVEAASTEDGIVHPGKAATEIFIYPGYHFKVLDSLITNFHVITSYSIHYTKLYEWVLRISWIHMRRSKQSLVSNLI